MKKARITASVISILVCAALLCPVFASLSFAEGTHGFYMECDSSVVGDKSNGFMIDFYSDSEDALCTYWSLANWHMNTDATRKARHYSTITGGGCYNGLQIRGSKDDHVGIMAMWQYEYRERGVQGKQILRAKVMYGTPGSYDNEGSGDNCIMTYKWQNSQWYRELLYCWNDEETGTTMVGTWFYDYTADKWTLFSYFDSNLIDSYIEGGISQFLENYYDYYNDRYRSLRFANVYFLSHDTGEWVSSPNVYLFSDANVKAVGEAKCGVADDKSYVWASVDGSSSVDTDRLITVRTTLNQSDKPAHGIPAIKSLNGSNTERIQWRLEDNSTPQLSYKLTVTDPDGKVIAETSGTRPEVNRVSVGEIEAEEYKCTLTITDVFGATATKEYTTKGYPAENGDPEPVTPVDQPSDGGETGALDPEPAKKTVNKKAIIAAAIGGGVLVAVATAAAVTVTVVRKKKKK